MVAPTALGVTPAWLLAREREGVARRRALVVAAAIATGLVLGVLHIRVFTFVLPLAMTPLAVVIAEYTSRMQVEPLLRALRTAFICLAVSPIGFAAVLPPYDEEKKDEARDCYGPDVVKPLDGLAPGAVAADVNFGSYLLAYTRHSAFAAPYHRDNHGNRIVFDAFLAPPDEAAAILRAAGARYLLWCTSNKGIGGPLAKKAPQGLAAALEKGEPPAWLERLPFHSEAIRVYAVRPAT
jgi:hypothetical protein